MTQEPSADRLIGLFGSALSVFLWLRVLVLPSHSERVFVAAIFALSCSYLLVSVSPGTRFAWRVFVASTLVLMLLAGFVFNHSGGTPVLPAPIVALVQGHVRKHAPPTPVRGGLRGAARNLSLAIVGSVVVALCWLLLCVSWNPGEAIECRCVF